MDYNKLSWEKTVGENPVYLNTPSFKFRGTHAYLKALAKSKMMDVFSLYLEDEDENIAYYERISYLLFDFGKTISFYGIYKSQDENDQSLPSICVRSYKWDLAKNYTEYYSDSVNKLDFLLGETQISGGVYFPAIDNPDIKAFIEEMRDQIVKSGFQMENEQNTTTETVPFYSLQFYLCYEDIEECVDYTRFSLRCPLIEDVIAEKFIALVENVIKKEQYIPTTPLYISYDFEGSVGKLLYSLTLGQTWSCDDNCRSSG